jgi:hypothetical protein
MNRYVQNVSSYTKWTIELRYLNSCTASSSNILCYITKGGPPTISGDTRSWFVTHLQIVACNCRPFWGLKIFSKSNFSVISTRFPTKPVAIHLDQVSRLRIFHQFWLCWKKLNIVSIGLLLWLSETSILEILFAPSSLHLELPLFKVSNIGHTLSEYAIRMSLDHCRLRYEVMKNDFCRPKWSICRLKRLKNSAWYSPCR